MRLRTLLPLAALALAAACSSKSPSGREPDSSTTLPTPDPRPDQKAELDAIAAERTASAGLTADGIIAKYPLTHVSALGYDPTAAAALDKIGASSLAMNDAERAVLAKHGFVISERHRFPSFTLGYGSIFSQDLPVFVSADAILEAVHRSYDKLLLTFERELLVKELQVLLSGMRTNLAAATSMRPSVRADLDVYLAVALGLLSKEPVGPVASGSKETIDAIVALAKAGTGRKTVTLFGEPRDEDFSQFTPRGHYVGDPIMEAYFRASMWLGRIDFRLIETQPDYTQRLNREQVEATLAVGTLMGEPERAAWRAIDSTIGVFVGETDAMTPAQIEALRKDLGGDVASVDDAKLRSIILAGGYGAQRISSHIMINGLEQMTMPLSSSFLILGQRYVIDSHVFSNVVFDRVVAPGSGLVKRMMPNPLDVAFAALRNDQALPLLKSELTKYPYAPDLHMMRFLVDKQAPAFWESSLYNLWVDALRSLSPVASEVSKPKEAGLPTVTGTEPWGRRILNTQLASWAELRHDTLLYAKQSYTGGAACEFADAYVDPYPEVYAKLQAFATRGRSHLATLDMSKAPGLKSGVDAWFANLETVAKQLRAVAEQERKGVALTTEQLAWFDQMVRLDKNCDGTPIANGWYPQLHYGFGDTALKFDPVIADVHTQPTDEGGNDVGKVLHVGTGSPRSMFVTFDTCTGPRAYVGVVSSYFETTTQDWKRLTDQAWADSIKSANPADVAWMNDLVAR